MKLVIFDWDGTLCDSTAKIARCVQLAADSIGLPVLSEVEVKGIIGLGLIEACRTLYPDIHDNCIQQLAKAYSQQFLQDDERPPLYPGALEFMGWLAENGIPMAIATGKSRKGLDRVLGDMALIHWFAFTRCADETASKPNPQMLRELLALANCDAHESVMIGDTEFDLAMAAAIEMPRVGVTYGAHKVERLEVHSPALLIDDLRLCMPWVTSQLSL